MPPLAAAPSAREAELQALLAARDAEGAELRAQLAAARAAPAAALAQLAAREAERDAALARAVADAAALAAARRERDEGRARMAQPNVRCALLGERLLDVVSIVAAAGYAVEVSQLRGHCGVTWRRGVRRADGTLDEAGYRGGTADMMAQSLRLQVPWAEAARK